MTFEEAYSTLDRDEFVDFVWKLRRKEQEIKNAWNLIFWNIRSCSVYRCRGDRSPRC